MTKDKLSPFGTGKEYHKEYYRKNKELIRAKRLLTEKNIVTQDVKQWKIDKMNDPWAFYPFYDPNSKKRYGDEEDILDISYTSIPYSSPTLTG